MQVTTILLVDDDEDDIEFFTGVVHRIDPAIKIHVATSKDQLLAHMVQSAPNLFFIDTFLQHDSGFDCIKKIRENKTLEAVPVIMYTGAVDMQSIKAGFEAGASLYIVKPSTLPEVKAVLEKIFSLELKQLFIAKQYYLDGHFKKLESI